MRWSEPTLRLIGVLLAAGALCLEALCGWRLLVDDSTLHGLLALLHGLACAAGGGGAALLLPARQHGARREAWLFLFLAQLFVPLLGLLGILAVLLPALHRHAPRAEGTWETRTEPELPFKPAQISADAVFQRVGLAAMARYLDDQNLRRRVVMATRHVSGYRAVPILRQALADPADEVRLLAYSMLTGKERSFEIEIHRLQDELDRATPAAADWLHEQIAALYWEQVALGLVEGEVRTYVLHQAAQHIATALATRSTGSRQLLLGKIAMRLDRLGQAQQALEQAQRLGVVDSAVVPVRAELAFLRGDFDRVAFELKRLSPGMRAMPQFAPLVSYWQ